MTVKRRAAGEAAVQQVHSRPSLYPNPNGSFADWAPAGCNHIVVERALAVRMANDNDIELRNEIKHDGFRLAVLLLLTSSPRTLRTVGSGSAAGVNRHRIGTPDRHPTGLHAETQRRLTGQSGRW